METKVLDSLHAPKLLSTMPSAKTNNNNNKKQKHPTLIGMW